MQKRHKSEWADISPSCVGFSLIDVKWGGETSTKHNEFGIGILQPYVNHGASRALFGFHRVFYKPTKKDRGGRIELYFCLFWLLGTEWEYIFSFKWLKGERYVKN